MDTVALIERARQVGLTIWAEGDVLKVEGHPTHDALAMIEPLRHDKFQILARLRQEAGAGHQPWMLREWRRVSIPDWRRILTESVNQGDLLRADYARWMLREVLLDPEYEDGG